MNRPMINFDLRDCYKRAKGGYMACFDESGIHAVFLKRGKVWRVARLELWWAINPKPKLQG